MTIPACLVTSTPDFQETPRTRPILIGATAQPSLRNVVVIDDQTSPVAIEFIADVALPESDDLVYYALYLDYGKKNELRPNQPFTASFDNFKPLDPKTQRSQPIIKAQWIPSSPDYGYGCHTITLIASHGFDPVTGCPDCRNDSSQLTWQIYRCDSSGKAGAPPCNPTDFTPCQGWTETCPAAADTEDADAGARCGDAP